jgi:hypothetical protein
MSTKGDLAVLVLLATVFAMLVAIIAVPTASDAATFPSHTVHRITEPGYWLGNIDPGADPQSFGGGPLLAK